MSEYDDARIAFRDAFDASFAEPPSSGDVDRVALLALRIGEARVALPVADLEGVTRHPKIVALPSSAPGFLGLSALRGRVVPVYSLAALLGLGADGTEWLASCRSDEPLAFAFGSLEGFENPSAADMRPVGRDAGAHVAAAVLIGDRPTFALDTKSIFAAVRGRIAPSAARAAHSTTEED